jgi:hypothetical protein
VYTRQVAAPGAAGPAQNTFIKWDIEPAGVQAVAAPAPAAPAGQGSGSGYGLRSANVDYLAPAGAAPMGLPPNAKPGDCYIQAVVPAQQEAVKERVLKKAAATRIEVVPAQLQEVEERVMVRPATKRLEVVPATFEDTEEQVMVRPASKRLESVPATYKTETEQVLVRAAYTVWKRSSELTAAERAQQTVDLTAGDILCLVEVPAEYATITRQVIDTPAATREVEVPAEWAKVKKSVIKTPATTREIDVPAEYQTMKIMKVTAVAREVKTEIPAEWEEVTKQVVKAPATTEWREILCDTNATPETIVALQQALKRAGFDPGRVDGRVDNRTMDAVRAFQQAKNLPVDTARYINIATVKALGVTP